MRWPDLCNTLRHQYKGLVRILSSGKCLGIGNNIMEKVDSFYDDIVEISHRLSMPLQENVLVEILRRNLLPEIQHEILNIPIYSVTHL
ncbi:hypothetical protein CVS40_8609 [Lucilia cuprina]|nr:hypothetical protein CVS40_8609 [Lucilia cuprina]